MVGLPDTDVDEYAARAAFYRFKAAEARARAARANATVSACIRESFLQIARSYDYMASAIDDIAWKRSARPIR